MVSLAGRVTGWTERGACLIWSIGQNYIAVRQLHLDDIAEKDFEALLLGFALYPFGDLSRHARVELDSNDFLCFLEDLHSKISSARSDLKLFE